MQISQKRHLNDLRNIIAFAQEKFFPHLEKNRPKLVYIVEKRPNGEFGVQKKLIDTIPCFEYHAQFEYIKAQYSKQLNDGLIERIKGFLRQTKGNIEQTLMYCRLKTTNLEQLAPSSEIRTCAFL